MNAPIIIAPVRKSVRVKAPVARAFDASPAAFHAGGRSTTASAVQLQLWVRIFCLQSR